MAIPLLSPLSNQVQGVGKVQLTDGSGVNGHLASFNSAGTLVDAGTATGPQGNQGFQGTTGTTGSQGNQGNQGAQGASGSNGSTGSQGNQGNQGSQGSSGAQGNQGNQGPQGTAGTTGGTGSQGNQGNQGNQGFQGSGGGAGSQGNQGNQGTQGATGTTGTTGSQGNQGNQGFQGSSGSSGSQGNQGTQGNQGNQGAQPLTGASATLTLTPSVGGNFTVAHGLGVTPSYVIPVMTSDGIITGQSPIADSTNVYLTASDGGITGKCYCFTSSIGGGGPQGTQGNQGNTGGPQGNQGAQGASGSGGSQGNQGNQGAQGASGGTGSQGNQGTQGTTGTTGTTGSQGNQGNQGNQGATNVYAVQGTQQNLSAQTFTNIAGLTTAALVISKTYQLEAMIGVQVAAGTQGVQWAVQCSVGAATVAIYFEGNQTALGQGTQMTNGWLVSQGTQGTPTNKVAGNGFVYMCGIVTTPGSGSPTIGIQAKGQQASTVIGIQAGSFLRLTATS